MTANVADRVKKLGEGDATFAAPRSRVADQSLMTEMLA